MENTLLLKQIKENRRKFRVDHFDIVISEYINKYNSNEIILDPPYQRKFRWDESKQSELIESILIGIPIPPIFVFSNSNFEWEIIDGVQRTNTLINFLSGNLIITGCSILTELNKCDINTLPTQTINAIKNARIRVELVEDNADSYSQYLLFSRLNSNGEDLSGQELRNFLIYKLNSDFYSKLFDLRNNTSFLNLLKLSDNRIQKQEDVEYLLRFIILHSLDYSNLSNKNYKKIDELLTKETELFLKNTNENYLLDLYQKFIDTFEFLDSILTNGFKSYHARINSVVNTSVIAPAIAANLNYYQAQPKTKVLKTIQEFYNTKDYIKITAQSYSPTKRFFELGKFSMEYFGDHE